ncbi:MAG: family 78 glycoside hydrolase catalytic domain, partial [Bacteroidaceae bacterium]|nr:family 78 glycoside hydrolase catalytic domain [Bacteroidaceae bacterium]
MKRLFLSAVTVMCSAWMLGAGLSVTNLRVDGVVNPIGIDHEQPLLSWTVYDGDLKGVEQTTFQVQIYSDARCTKRVWNSRTQRSSDSWILAPALNGWGTRYYWRVTCWDNKGRQVISKTATFVTGLNGSDWEGAKWLKGNRQSWDKQDGATVLRKKINLTGKKKIELARVFAASLGVFDLYINGQRVGYEDPEGATQYAELKPGWTNYDKEIPYMTFDVTDMVKKGENMVGVQLTNGWWGGEISGNHYPADRQLGFMAKVYVMYADSTVETFITDPSWEQNQCGPLLYGDIYNGETYDARRDYSWTSLSDASTGWKPAETMTAPTDSVYAFEGPLVVIRNQYEQSVKKVTVWEGTKQTGTTYGEINVKNTIDNPAKLGFVLHKGETAIFDMGQNMVGWPQFTVKGNAGAEITCHFGEMLNDDGSEDHINDGPAGSVWTHNMRTAKTTLRYILSGNPKGETYHPSTTFFGFRYISMTATEDVTIMNLVGQVVGSDINEGATFECSDPSVNQLFKNIQWGARGNFLSIPTDCPQRDERLGWSGDTQMFSRTA